MTSKKKILTIFTSLLLTFVGFAGTRDVVMHKSGKGGHDEIYVDPPYVTYDDESGELCVYFGSSGNITLDYIDSTGTPCTYVYLESHYWGETACYTNLPAGYYTINIHSIYNRTYTGNFTVN